MHKQRKINKNIRNIFFLLLIFSSTQILGQISNETTLRCGTEKEKALEYFNSANFGLQTNRLEGAKKLFMASVEIDSTFCDAWDNLSVCCRRLGQYDEAFYASLHSIDIDSTNSVAWSNCGYAAFLGGNIEIALKSFDNLQRIVPNNPEGYYGKSFVLYSIDSITEAKKNINLAIEKYKKVGKEVRLLQGLIEFKSGNYLKSQEILQSIYSKFKNNAELNYILGECYLKNENNQKKANKFKSKAIALGYKTDKE